MSRTDRDDKEGETYGDQPFGEFGRLRLKEALIQRSHEGDNIESLGHRVIQSLVIGLFGDYVIRPSGNWVKYSTHLATQLTQLPNLLNRMFTRIAGATLRFFL